MKKILILPLLAFLFLSACSSNNDDTPSNDADTSGSSNNGDTSEPTDDEPAVVDKSQNLLATGASANDLLSNINFDHLLIEVAFVTGFRPTAQTVDNFVQYIQEQTFKQNIDVEYLELDSPDEETLTLQEISDLENENRTAYNNGTTLGVYIYFADAPSDGDDEDEGLVTLGAVYRNTSMVIFEQTIRTLAINSSSSITTTDIETATLNHEFGHLFGLVNLGSDPVNDHEDPEAENHCVVEGCLMRAELVFENPNAKAFSANSKDDLVSACSLSGISVLNLLESRMAKGQAIVPGLDAECILDLQNNGGQ